MNLCKNGHLIPEGVNGVCARCGNDARKEKRFGKPKKHQPEQHFRESGSFASAGNVAGSVSSEPAVDPRSITQEPYSYPLRPPVTPKNTPKKRLMLPRDPALILQGIRQLLRDACGVSNTIEAILHRNQIARSKIREIARVGHLFVGEVRERWFRVFTHVLAREQARVVARKYMLDGLPAVKNNRELAERCDLSVKLTESLLVSGLTRLKQPNQRNALIYAVTEAAKCYR